MKKCSYVQYAAKATVAMPNPGKADLKRLNLVNGPVYLHFSLKHRQSVYVQKRSSRLAHFLNHGSPRLSPAAAAKAFGSKPVRFGRAALLTLGANVSHNKS